MAEAREDRAAYVERGAGMVAVELLKLVKSSYDYKSLSQVTGLPTSTLSRYVKGRTFPRGQKAKQLLEKLVSVAKPEKIVSERINSANNELDASPLVFDTRFLKIINAYATNAFAGRKITCVMALDNLSLPLATSIGLSLDRKIVYVSDRPLWNDADSIHVTYYVRDLGERRGVWIPKQLLSNRESFLLVCGVLMNSLLPNALISYMKKSNMVFAGIFALAASKQSWDEITLPPTAKVSVTLV